MEEGQVSLPPVKSTTSADVNTLTNEKSERVESPLSKRVLKEKLL